MAKHSFYFTDTFSPIGLFFKFNNENCCAMQKTKRTFFTSGLLDLRNNVNSGTMSTSLTCHGGKKSLTKISIQSANVKRRRSLCLVCALCDFKQ